MVGYSDLVQAEAGIVLATLYVEPARSRLSAGAVYSTDEEAHLLAADQLAYYMDLTAREPHIRVIATEGQLERHLADWSLDRRYVGFVLLMEGADPIRTPEEVEYWSRRGLRIVGPAWHATRYSGGTGEPGPLTPSGRLLLDHMSSLGMILDVSHMSDESCAESLDRYEGAIIASHSNCRMLAPGDRQLADPMIRRLGERDAVIGVAFSDRQLRGASGASDPNRGPVTLDDVVDHIDHLCQVLGDTRHVALGTDIDGGFGVERTPQELDSYGDVPKLAAVLERRGYSGSEIGGIFGTNLLKKLREGLLPAG
jgi:membrane dipeptidase